MLPEPKPGEFRYFLATTDGSSAKYGNCEVCNQHCTEVFSQRQERFYQFENSGETYSGWTQSKCHFLFGHESCLKAKQIKFSKQ